MLEWRLWNSSSAESMLLRCDKQNFFAQIHPPLDIPSIRTAGPKFVTHRGASLKSTQRTSPIKGGMSSKPTTTAMTRSVSGASLVEVSVFPMA